MGGEDFFFAEKLKYAQEITPLVLKRFTFKLVI